MSFPKVTWQCWSCEKEESWMGGRRADMGDPPVSWQIVERSTGPGGYRYLSGIYCSYICLGAALQAPAESP